MSEEHEHRVLGGHKAALHNPRVGAEAKMHSVGVLNDGDIDVNVHHGHATFDPPSAHDRQAAQAADEGHDHLPGKGAGSVGGVKAEKGEEGDDEHRRRVIGGYKATLSNPSTSEEAKEHARQKLREAGEEV